MKASVVGSLLFAAAVCAGQVHAQELDLSQCTFPEAPPIPDGSAASEDEMANASAAVRAFISSTEAGLACLDAARQAHTAELSEAHQAHFNGVWDAAVDAMNLVANSYNQEVREFKAANPG